MSQKKSQFWLILTNICYALCAPCLQRKNDNNAERDLEKQTDTVLPTSIQRSDNDQMQTTPATTTTTPMTLVAYAEMSRKRTSVSASTSPSLYN